MHEFQDFVVTKREFLKTTNFSTRSFFDLYLCSQILSEK